MIRETPSYDLLTWSRVIIEPYQTHWWIHQRDLKKKSLQVLKIGSCKRGRKRAAAFLSVV
jgi:hypothetical protein